VIYPASPSPELAAQPHHSSDIPYLDLSVGQHPSTLYDTSNVTVTTGHSTEKVPSASPPLSAMATPYQAKKKDSITLSAVPSGHPEAGTDEKRKSGQGRSMNRKESSGRKDLSGTPKFKYAPKQSPTKSIDRDQIETEVIINSSVQYSPSKVPSGSRPPFHARAPGSPIKSSPSYKPKSSPVYQPKSSPTNPSPILKPASPAIHPTKPSPVLHAHPSPGQNPKRSPSNPSPILKAKPSPMLKAKPSPVINPKPSPVVKAKPSPTLAPKSPSAQPKSSPLQKGSGKPKGLATREKKQVYQAKEKKDSTDASPVVANEDIAKPTDTNPVEVPVQRDAEAAPKKGKVKKGKGGQRN